MVTQTRPGPETAYKFSVAQFEQMIVDGIFAEDDRVELIDGGIVRMSPINHEHAAVVSNLEFTFREKLGRRVYVWAQQPVLLSEHSRPQPDVALLKWRDDRYMAKPPAAEDVPLLIEVADTSLATDRGVKRAKYAEAGISEYWIVNPPDKVVEVYATPVAGSYENQRVTSSGDLLPLPGGLQEVLSVEQILS